MVSDNYNFIIVIPSFNEGNLIISTLNSIAEQKLIDLEQILVIIMINNSDKATPEILKENQKFAK